MRRAQRGRPERREATARASHAEPAAPAGSSRRAAQVLIVSVGVAIGLAGLVLLGWVFDLAVLRSGIPGEASMKTNTAMAVVLIGASVLLARGTHPSPARVIVARMCAACATLVAALTLSQDLFGWELGLDELVFDETRAASSSGAPNRMAPNTSVAFMLLGAALLLHRRQGHSADLRQGLAIAVAAMSYLALVGYFYGSTSLYWIGRNTAMAPSTALALLLLATATLCVPPPARIAAVLQSPLLGGHLARRLLPAAILVPMILGLLRLAGERAGLYETELGTTLLISATVLLFGGATWWSAAVVDRLDAERVAAMHAIRAESKARDLERRRLRAVLEVLPVGVFLADASGRLVEINRAARTIWSDNTPTAGELAQYGGYRGWWPDSGAPLRPDEWALARALTRGELRAAEEVEIEPAPGQRRTILNYASPIRDEQGGVAGAVAVNIDITDRKRTERELRALKDQLEERVRSRTAELAAANAELEAFSYSVSHDLRAPLRWVDGFSQALAEDYGERLDEPGREYIRQLRESVQHMSELIDALLKLSRITRASLQRADVDLSQIAREIAAELDASDRRRQVIWEISDGVHASADPRLARVVLDNLLRNAWKFTRTRQVAQIQVGVSNQSGEEVYFVRDNGVGFDMAYANKLFRSFERLHRAEEFEGTGVGLALVQRVVQRHGGRAWADGRVGEGATFFFTLGAREASS